MAKSDITRAALAFQDWDKPWTFESAVLDHLSDALEDQTVLAHIWIEACRSENWQQVDLSKCCDVCHSWLSSKFPWLPEEARAQFVRAASFQWK